jgi:uncharacterized protein involved in exopolysaccharide biosynthesis
MADINNSHTDDISLKELIFKIKEYADEVKNNWKVVIVFIALSLLFFFFKHFTTPNLYNASLTFMVNENEGGGGLAGASSILNTLGFNGQAEDNLDRILALSKSMRIIEEVLLTKTVVDGDTDFIGNIIIKKYDYDNKNWNKSKSLKGFRFKHTNVDSFSIIEKKALRAVYEKVVGSSNVPALMSNGQSRQTAIMTINITTISDELSVSLCKTVFEKLSSFYIEKAVEREKETYNLVKTKADSIKRLLIGADYASAKFEDSNRGLLMETVKVPTKQLSRDVGRLTIMYGEAVKNLELSDFALKNKTPYVQTIDIPFSPLSPSESSWKKVLIISLGVGTILSVLFLISRKLLREVLK